LRKAREPAAKPDFPLQVSVISWTDRALRAAFLLVHGSTANCSKFFDLWQWIAAVQ